MPRPGRPTTERAKDFKGTLRQLLAAMSRYKLPLIVVVVFAILSTIFNIAGPKILAKATTALATGWIAKLRGVGSIDFAYIGRVLLFLAGMYLFSAAFSFLQGWLMTGLSQKVCYDFRDQINKKINRLPLAYFMSIQPNASLTMIGLSAPTSTAVGILLNISFFLWLKRYENQTCA